MPNVLTTARSGRLASALIMSVQSTCGVPGVSSPTTERNPTTERKLAAAELAARARTDIPNILTLLQRPRASLPPVDFELLSRPISSSKRQPARPASARHRPEAVVKAIFDAYSRGTMLDAYSRVDDWTNLRPRSARAVLRPRRRAAAADMAALLVLQHSGAPSFRAPQHPSVSVVVKSQTPSPIGGASNRLAPASYPADASAPPMHTDDSTARPARPSSPRSANRTSTNVGGAMLGVTSRPASASTSRSVPVGPTDDGCPQTDVRLPSPHPWEDSPPSSPWRAQLAYDMELREMEQLAKASAAPPVSARDGAPASVAIDEEDADSSVSKPSTRDFNLDSRPNSGATSRGSSAGFGRARKLGRPLAKDGNPEHGIGAAAATATDNASQLASSQFTFTAGSHSHPVHIHSQLASRPPSAAPAPTGVAPVASAPAASPSVRARYAPPRPPRIYIRMVDGEGADEAVGDRISDAVAHTAQQTATSLAPAPAPVAAKAWTEASHSQQLRVPTAPGTGFAAVVARKPPRSGRTHQKSRY